jgi:hypothetical protein
MIPIVPKPKLDQALKTFDKIERHLPQWKNWEQQPGHEFVITTETGHKCYPVKHIIAAATGLPETAFDELEAFQYLPARGFRVVSLARFLEYLPAPAPTKKSLTKTSAPASPPPPVPDSQLYNPALLQIRLDRFQHALLPNETEPYVSFTHPFYLNNERNYKVASSQRLQTTLSRTALSDLIASGDFTTAAKLIRSIANHPADNLLYKPFEIISLLNAPDQELTLTLFDLLYGEGPFTPRFQAWIDLLSRDKSLCWPAATYFLMYHDPSTHIFIKPGPTGKFLKAIGSGLTWQPRTTPAFYSELQRLARALLPQLAPLGTRDFIDVQSFIWLMRDYQ